MARKEKGLEQRVLAFIQKHDLFSTGQRLVVAVSGGADSVCLLHVLAKNRDKLGVELHVAHLNHRLRGDESDADAAYVLNLAHKLKLPVLVEQRDVAAYQRRHSLSLEEAARNVRYNFLAEVIQDVGAVRAVVGHTRDDHVETILLHLLRGSGVSGLRGLLPRTMLSFSGKRLEVVRPLLEISRQETQEYCQRHKLRPCFDTSNESLLLLRNRIRLELLPILREFNMAIDDALVRLAGIATADVSFVEEQALRSWRKVAKVDKNAIYLDVARLKVQPLALQRQIFKEALARLRGSLEDVEASHIESMLDFLSRPAGKRLSLPDGLTLTTEYDRMVLAPKGISTCTLLPLDGSFKIEVPGETTLPGWRVKADVLDGGVEIAQNDFVATFDFAKTGKELTVRGRKPGDRFQPLGMTQTKKLQDFMVDAKIPVAWRDGVPLVCSPQQILWVVGWRIDDRAKVTSASRQILRLEFHKTK
ncbi:MAG: tRNA lysidine(34) synthetase TilS [Chloroflexi bacterium]|nr:tRNA lysidine(34) synthetase TilS [Chloroflexota bacterium]